MSAGRIAAVRAVAGVLAGQALDRSLEATGVSADARAFAQALAYACVRHLGSNRALLGHLLSDPGRRRPPLLDALILCGLADLRQLRRAPHAAVAETVACCRSLGLTRQSGLVNALLRRYLRESEALQRRIDEDEEAHTEHPRWWLRRLRQDWPAQAARMLAADNERAPLWLRVNRRRLTRTAAMDVLGASGLHCSPHASLPDALRVEPPRPVEGLAGFSEGAVSVQDAAAQRVLEAIALAPGLRVLDACAAPGGKTAHLLERCPQLRSVLALDADAARLQRVEANLQRLQLQDAPIRLQAADARRPQQWWDGQPFDRILIDAPCSGSGVARRHPDIKWLRREADIDALARTQGELLDALWPLLAPGGRLVYATCSVFAAENDAVVAAFLQRQPAACSLPCTDLASDPELHASVHGLQRFSGDAQEDGFYLALLGHADAGQAAERDGPVPQAH